MKHRLFHSVAIGLAALAAPAVAQQPAQLPPTTADRLAAQGAEAVAAIRDGQALLNRSRFREAEPLFLRAKAIVEELFGDTHSLMLPLLNNLSLVYHHQGKYAEAEASYLRVIDGMTRINGEAHADTLTAMHNLASLLYDQGRDAEALALFVKILPLRERLHGRVNQDTLSTAIGAGLASIGMADMAAAETYLRPAYEDALRGLGADHALTLNAATNLATLYRDTNRTAEAERLFREALAGRERTFDALSPEVLNSLDMLGRLYRREQRFREAEPLLARAARGSVQLYGEDHPYTQRRATELAEARLSLNDRSGALEAARIAVSGAIRRGASGAGDRYHEAQRGREEASERERYRLFADAAWVGGPNGAPTEHHDVLHALQRALGGNANEAIARSAIRRYADSQANGLGALIQERDALNEQWRLVVEQFSRALSASGPDGETERARIQAERTALTTRLVAIDARLRAGFPDYFTLVSPLPLDAPQAQALVGPNEAILLAVPSGRGTHVMAITREDVVWHRSDWTAERIGAAAERLRWDASGNAQGDPERVRAWAEAQRPEAPGFDRRTAYALYQELIAPVARSLAGKRRVYVAAGGALSALPFSFLVAAPPTGADHDPAALRATAWLADRYALVHIPSVQSLALLRRTNRMGGRRGDAFVGFGDPALAGAPAQGRGTRSAPAAETIFQPERAPWGGAVASVSALRGMAQLPGTARELDAMRTMFGGAQARLFTRAAATETAVRTADLSGARVLAFATHGLTPGEAVGDRTASELYELIEPGLVLTPPETASAGDDGYLAASEVTALRLNADWVILSACNSATPDDAAEPGLSSLARAFFYAGARNLLASHWPVDDEVGARITVRTLELERGGTSRAEAFQRAMREIRDEPTRAAWAHPFYWSPFVLIGDGG